MTWFALTLATSFVFTIGAFRCQYEEDLDATTNKTELLIKPQKSLDGKFLWVTSMNIFFFGNIERKFNAKLQAGLYDDETGALVYKVIINCQDGGTWKTVYDKNGNGNFKKWKKGKLEEGCPKGEFDLVARVGCPDRPDEQEEIDLLPCSKMAYFVFNGQVLEDNLQKLNRYGSEHMEPLPVFIRPGKLVKAQVLKEGATFTRQAYGKCFDFPAKFHNNCTAALYWLRSRSDSPHGLSDMGLWSMGHGVECVATDTADPDHKLFKTLQTKIVPDGSAIFEGRAFDTCCCSYLDGYVITEEGSCLNNLDDEKNCNMSPRPGFDDMNDERCNRFKAFYAIR
ncbi:uncharacterized protein LOC134814711 [Bolinopsis microptera]|uniref:uncharacterized protein LOC134814711 n=1 Tax=Bolinopsis microptera TaxID=2820187 RepID=UPI00307A485B